MFEQEQSIGEYRTIWTNALVMERSQDLQDSLLRELGFVEVWKNKWLWGDAGGFA
jgi:hypothetical protein